MIFRCDLDIMWQPVSSCHGGSLSRRYLETSVESLEQMIYRHARQHSGASVRALIAQSSNRFLCRLGRLTLGRENWEGLLLPLNIVRSPGYLDPLVSPCFSCTFRSLVPTTCRAPLSRCFPFCQRMGEISHSRRSSGLAVDRLPRYFP